jgi:hypothetical protein
MPADRNDPAARRARWQRYYEAMPEPARAAHDREKARLREARESQRQAEEAELRARIDKAVAEALAVQVPQALAEARTEITETTLAAMSPEERNAVGTEYLHARMPRFFEPRESVEWSVSNGPLHELSEEEWAAQRMDYWSRALPQHSSTPNGSTTDPTARSES